MANLKRRPPVHRGHDRTAHASGGAAAGIFSLQKGEPQLRACRFAYWMIKPRGDGYDRFYQTLEPWTCDTSASLWRRQMVLGPTPEFGLFSPTPLELPAELTPIVVRLEPVWPR